MNEITTLLQLIMSICDISAIELWGLVLAGIGGARWLISRWHQKTESYRMDYLLSRSFMFAAGISLAFYFLLLSASSSYDFLLPLANSILGATIALVVCALILNYLPKLIKNSTKQ